MKLTDLKSPYRELAEMRREKNPHPYNSEFENTNYLSDAFWWIDAPEPRSFWKSVNDGEQPPIPQSSLDELSEWQNGKEPKKGLRVLITKAESFLWYVSYVGRMFDVLDEVEDGYYIDVEGDGLKKWHVYRDDCKLVDYEPTAIIESPDHRLFTAAVAAMQGIISSKAYHATDWEAIARVSVGQAQALLTELNKVK
jgi:hypothetical protein